jgi:hypothetical protein
MDTLNFRGLCTRCGIAHSDPKHTCTDAEIRLLEIDKEAGPRAVREMLLDLGKKGFNNKIETLELEATTIRTAIQAEKDAKEAARLAEEALAASSEFTPE